MEYSKGLDNPYTGKAKELELLSEQVESLNLAGTGFGSIVSSTSVISLISSSSSSSGGNSGYGCILSFSSPYDKHTPEEKTSLLYDQIHLGGKLFSSVWGKTH